MDKYCPLMSGEYKRYCEQNKCIMWSTSMGNCLIALALSSYHEKISSSISSMEIDIKNLKDSLAKDLPSLPFTPLNLKDSD